LYGSLSTLFIREHGLEDQVKPATGTISGIDRSWSAKRKGTIKVQIFSGQCTAEAEMEVVDQVEPVIIGLLLFPELGYSINGVPIDFPSGKSGHEKAEVAKEAEAYLYQRPKAWAPEYFYEETQRNELLAAIKDLVDENSKCQGVAASAIPESVIKIESKQHIFVPQYPIPLHMHPAVDKQIADWQEQGVVRKARTGEGTQSNTPLTAGKKKDAHGNKTGTRVCMDSRKTNDNLDTTGEADISQEPPRIADVLKRIQGFKIGTSLDCDSGFTQFAIDEASKGRTAFRWKGVRYVWNRWFFGIKIATGRFQRVMEIVLDGVECVIIFVDDIFIFTKTDDMDAHIRTVREVLKRLNSHNILLNAKKCHFGFTKVLLLGHLVGGNARSPDPLKVQTAIEWPMPTTGKAMQRFLGFMNFVRDYIPQYAVIAQPLIALAQRKTFAPDDTAQAAHKMLVESLQHAPVLKPMDHERPLVIATDASQYGLGAILYQEEQDGTRRFIQFASTTLKGGQENYSATKRELLGIIFALRKFHFYIYGGPKFILYTDHKALTALFTKHELSRVMADWLTTLLEYNFEVRHRPGVSMIMPDALSRVTNEIRAREERQKNNAAKAATREERQKENAAKAATSVINEIRAREERQEANAAKAATSAHNENTRSHTHPVIRKAQVVVDVDEMPPHTERELKQFIRERLLKQTIEGEEERAEYLRKAHAELHQGADALFRKVFRAGYFWQGLRKDCQATVQRCTACLRWNVAREGFHPVKNLRADAPWDHVAIDLLKLDKSKTGMMAVLIMVDVATRYVVTKPLPDCKAKTIAAALYEVISLFGPPKVMQSDNGPEFVNSTLEQLCKQASINHRFVAAYNPRANGLAETMVKKLKLLLKKQLEGQIDVWDRVLPGVTLQMNMSDTALSKTPPFTLFHGRIANTFSDYRLAELKLQFGAGNDVPQAQRETIVAHSDIVNDVVMPAINEAVHARQDKQNAARDKKRKLVTQDYPPGSVVMLRTPDLVRPDSHPLYSGPHIVVRKNTRGTYTLEDMDGKIVQRKGGIPVSALKFVADTRVPLTDAHGDLIEQQKSYEVQKILQHEEREGENHFLVRWTDPTANDTWQRARDFDNVTQLTEYLRKAGNGKKSTNQRQRKGVTTRSDNRRSGHSNE
jgi:transposase InsO family protein